MGGPEGRTERRELCRLQVSPKTQTENTIWMTKT